MKFIGIGWLTCVALAQPAFAQSPVVTAGSCDWGQCNVPSFAPGQVCVGLSTGTYTGFALLQDGTVLGWGSNQSHQLDVLPLPPGVSYTQIAAADYHTLGLRSDGQLVAWGDGAGNWTPPALPPGTQYTAIEAGDAATILLRSDGEVFAWGQSPFISAVPALPAGTHYVQIALANHLASALRTDGEIVTWGQPTFTVPALPAGTTYVSVAGGGGHFLAQRSDGTWVGWGWNSQGEATIPDPPPGRSYVKMDGGVYFTLALLDDGSVVAWGGNDYGQCDIPPLPAGWVYTGFSSSNWFSALMRSPAAMPPLVYCTAKTNSLGCVPTIGFSGTLAISGPNDFVIDASDVRNFRSGLMFWGRAPMAVPFQGGTLCVAMPLVRTNLQDSGGTAGVDDCSGVFAYELTTEYLNAHALIAGDELYAQYWSRDPHAAPFFTSLSNALHMWVGP